MMKGRNNGKKLMAVRIVAHAFEIIHLLTDQNPIQVCPPSFVLAPPSNGADSPAQVLVDAIVNTGPREDSTRIGSQGTVRRQAVDVSPLRRVNQSIALLTIGVSSPPTFSQDLLDSPHSVDRPVTPPSATSSPLQNASLMNSSTPPRAPQTHTPSRFRNMSLSLFPYRLTPRIPSLQKKDELERVAKSNR